MFTLQGKLTFINIDQNYLKKLHNACSEVYYKSDQYENKPYIGILINTDSRKYVIPLSSAKEKHKMWKNVDRDRYLIYEMAKKSNMGKNDIWVEETQDRVKHILSVIDVKKMIPVIEGTYKRVNINADQDDTEEMKKYKDLLNKEYAFCLKIIDEIVEKADKIYDKQMKTGKVIKFCCDFRALEEVAEQMKRKETA